MSSIEAAIKQSTVTHLLLTISFLISGIILNVLQGTFYYLLRPLSKYWFRKLNYYFCYSLYSLLVFVAEWWSGSDVIVYIDKEDYKKYYGKEHAVLILNHTYDVDWLIGWIFCDRVGVLGNCKAYAKKSVQYVPTMGWAWKFSESVFLERNWEKDKYMIGKQVSEIADYPDPTFLLLFAEGTRFTEDKHEASVKFAQEHGLPILKHHLTPRTRGFTTSIPNLRGKFAAIYNIQMCFDKNSQIKPTVMNLLMGKPLLSHMYFERIPLDTVPEDEKEAAKWLSDLYVKKDRLMDSFLSTGDYFKTSGVKRLESMRIPRRPYSLMNMIFWSLLTLIPASYWLFTLLISGSTIQTFIGVIILAVAYLGLRKLVEQTKIDKGSSYGKNSPTTPTNQTNGASQSEK